MSAASPSAPDAAGRAPRQETVLARYPRWFKLTVTGVLLGLWLGPVAYRSAVDWTNRPAQDEAPALPDEHKAEGDGAEGAPPAPEMESHAESHAETPAPAADPFAGLLKQGGSEHGLADAGIKPAPIPADLNAVDAVLRLSDAPDLDLVEGQGDRVLPIVAADGRKPWQVYARPFDMTDPRPRIALIMTGLGLSRVATDTSVQRLPGPVTLAFDVQSPSLAAWLSRARTAGHETLVSLPLEPFDYPRSDPGPQTLLTSLSEDANRQRVLWALRQGAGYVGVALSSNTQFAGDDSRILSVLDEVQARGLLMLDLDAARGQDLVAMARGKGLPSAGASQIIDANPTPEAIDTALAYLEKTARIGGRAVGVASPLPVTMDRVAKWSRTLAARGIVLAPLSAVVE